MRRLVTLDDIRAFEGTARPLWIRVSVAAARVWFAFPRRIRVRAEGLQRVPVRGVRAILASNHSHWYDFVPLRCTLFTELGRFAATWIKVRAFQNTAWRFYFARTGNVPLASRGYIISADFLSVHGRKPTEEEYRPLRDHVNGLAKMPRGAIFERLGTLGRDLLGWKFDPEASTYREAVLGCYTTMMRASLQVCGRALQADHLLHVNPQGTASQRLTPGRTGVIQAALALDCCVVPVGISGMCGAFAPYSLRPLGGQIVIRFGEPYRPSREGLREDFQVFDPAHEEKNREYLERQAGILMERINDLCDPEYRRGPEGKSGSGGEGSKGVARFL